MSEDPDPIETLLSCLPRALAGDPDAVEEAFTEDVVFLDEVTGDHLTGIDEVRDVLGEYAGRRAMAEIDEVIGDDERAAVRFRVAFQADAHQYVHVGTAWVCLADGRIADWHAVWVETSPDS